MPAEDLNATRPSATSGSVAIRVWIFFCAATVLGYSVHAGAGLDVTAGGPREFTADALREGLQPVPNEQPVRRINLGATTDRRNRPSETGTALVFSNTTGTFLFAPGAGVAVGDDLATIGIEGCVLDSYSVRVAGGGDGTGPGFGVDLALFDDCPMAGGVVIARTQRSVELPDDGVFEITVDVSHAPMIIPQTVWVQLMFDSASAGWLAGAPAEVGFSYDGFSYPFGGCVAYFGGYPRFPHASFFAQVRVRDDCPEEHPGYRAYRASGTQYSAGAGVFTADDITLNTESCELASCTFGVRAGEGPYAIDVELREDPGPGDPIPGTARTFAGLGDGELELIRFTYGRGIDLPRNFWAAWKANRDGVGVVVAGEADIGSSADVYATLDPGNKVRGWSFRNFEGDPPAVFFVVIGCHGPAPTGACCVGPADGAAAYCQDDVLEQDCAGEWIGNVTCAEDPFTPSCGACACCLPDGRCEDLLEPDCFNAAGAWRLGVPCESGEQACPPVACLRASGSCFAVSEVTECTTDADCPDRRQCLPDGLCEGRAGCCVTGCCRAVCEADPFCCDTVWDERCADRAAEVCDPPTENDHCADPDPALGAIEIVLDAAGQALVESDNARACSAVDEPGFCCHGLEPGTQGFGTLWYTFIARHASTDLRVYGANGTADGFLLQVFQVADPTSDATSCDSLAVIGCQDGGIGADGNPTSGCLTGLTVGERYYLAVASRSPLGRGAFSLRVESPCPSLPDLECPEGPVTWIAPPAGVIDAGQPHPLHDPSMRQGIDTLIVRAPNRAETSCWSLRELGGEGRTNAIASVVSNGDNTYVILLDRPLTPGASSAVTYTSRTGCADATGLFSALPADVDADRLADVPDIQGLLDCCLNGTKVPPFGDYSCDLDRSGHRGPGDVLRLIDLLNGAGQYESWRGRRLPEPVN